MALILLCIGFIGNEIYKLYKNQYNKINTLNNKILEQKTEIIKINNICETLDLLKIYNDKYIIISINHINASIIIIFINIILLQYLQFISFISLIIIIIILYLGNKNNNKAIINFNEIETEIKNKKDDIDKKYIDNLLILVDASDDINNINLNIDEYISNYSYLHNFNNCKDKKIFIIELEIKLIEKKNNELMNIMNIRLKTFQQIIPEIVKYELNELNKDLDEYKKILEIKIYAINQQSQINSIIININ